MLGWDELVETFKRVTNLQAVYKDVPYDEWVDTIPWKDNPVAQNVPTGTTFGIFHFRRKFFSPMTNFADSTFAERFFRRKFFSPIPISPK